MLVIGVAVVAALATSEISGTGRRERRRLRADDGPRARARRSVHRIALARGDGGASTHCDATETNPGGDNNYLPDAPRRADLGDGFVVTGTVRFAAGCRALAGVPVQVWLATETGGEQDNRATVTTGHDGRFRIETAPGGPGHPRAGGIALARVQSARSGG